MVKSKAHTRKAGVSPREEVIFREEEVLPLSDCDRDRFLDLLNNPPPPSPALKRAKCSKPRTSAGKTTNRHVGVPTFAENKAGRLTTLFANVTTLSVNCPRTSVCAHIK
jgi:hypothetical protein